MLAEPSRTLAAWTDTRKQDVDGYGQDVFATEVDRGGGEGDDPPTGRLVGFGVGLVAGTGAYLILRRRRRAGPPVPPAGPASGSGDPEL